MDCPVCGVPLAMSDRQGVEIDYCPKCRGVWLDRGEIDRIVERERAAHGPLPGGARGAVVAEPPFSPDERERDRDRYRDDERHHGDKERRKHKRESFLEDLFDFG